MSESYIFEGKIKEFEDILIQFYIDVGKSRGQSSKLTRVLGYLMIHESLTQKQLKELTGFSLATVSNIIKPLVTMGFLRKQFLKGSNASAYTFGGTMIQTAELASGVKIQQLEVVETYLKSKIAQLNNLYLKNKKGQKSLLERIKELYSFIKFWKEFTIKTMTSITKDSR